jgi:hypothetical protein
MPIKKHIKQPKVQFPLRDRPITIGIVGKAAHGKTFLASTLKLAMQLNGARCLVLDDGSPAASDANPEDYISLKDRVNWERLLAMIRYFDWVICTGYSFQEIQSTLRVLRLPLRQRIVVESDIVDKSVMDRIANQELHRIAGFYDVTLEGAKLISQATNNPEIQLLVQKHKLHP